jgi:hypothetical protein
MLSLAETLPARLYAICVQPESLHPHSEMSAEGGISPENLRTFTCFLQVEEIIDNGIAITLADWLKKSTD